MRYCVGIDLGTTNTVLAVWEEGAPRPRVLPILQPGPSGPIVDALLPSAVLIPNAEDGGITVGHEARARHRLGQAEVVTSIKRSMGRRWAFPRRGERVWTPEEVSACILAAVMDELTRTLGRPPELVVITVPASFGTEARRATLRAARIAGFDSSRLELFDEPTAALLSQVWGGGGGLGAGYRRLAMIDIGGGTLDVSLLGLRRSGSKIVADVEGTSRYTALAGDDFDLALAGYLLLEYKRARPRAYDECTDEARKRSFCAELLVTAEELKTALSDAFAADPAPSARLRRGRRVECTPDGLPWEASVGLQDLRLALKDLFEDHSARSERLEAPSFFTPITQCLESAGRISGRPVALPGGVDQVYLAGGSARLPMVRMAVRRHFSVDATLVEQPKLAVALGAAWYAGSRRPDLFSTPNTLELRQRMYDDLFLHTADGAFRRLLPASTVVPTERPIVDEVRTSQPGPFLDLVFFVGSAGDWDSGPGAPAERGGRRGRAGSAAATARVDEEAPVDMLLTPLARRRVSFGEVLPADHPVSVHITVTSNREVRFAFDTMYKGRRCHGQVEISAGYGWVGEEMRRVPRVNASLSR